ncbi:hypothetical protein ALISP_2109 [Alicycliphilus sp. B1]|nr:hypothetical protein ALISP_2109 [Alicycliphilus sp. B1]
MTQANMIALPRDWAWDFLLYAQRNPKPCPVLDVIEAGAHQTLLAEGPTSAPTSPCTASGAMAGWRRRCRTPRPCGPSIPTWSPF